MFCPKKCGVKTLRRENFAVAADLSPVWGLSGNWTVNCRASNDRYCCAANQLLEGIRASPRWGKYAVHAFTVLRLVVSDYFGVSAWRNASRWWFCFYSGFSQCSRYGSAVHSTQNEQKFIPKRRNYNFNQDSVTRVCRQFKPNTPQQRPIQQRPTGDLVPPSIAEGTTRHLEWTRRRDNDFSKEIADDRVRDLYDWLTEAMKWRILLLIWTVSRKKFSARKRFAVGW